MSLTESDAQFERLIVHAGDADDIDIVLLVGEPVRERIPKERGEHFRNDEKIVWRVGVRRNAWDLAEDIADDEAAIGIPLDLLWSHAGQTTNARTWFGHTWQTKEVHSLNHMQLGCQRL